MLPRLTGMSQVVKLPVDGREVRVYAYSIRENKLFMMAKDEAQYTNNNDVIEDSVIEVLKEKVPDVNVEDLTYVDIIVLLITMMHISKGTKQILWYKCINEIDGVECGTEYSIGVDVMNFHVDGEPKNHQLVNVMNDISVQFEYPSYAVLKKLLSYVDDSVSEAEYTARLCAHCISAVYQGDEAYVDVTPEEIYDWILGFPPSLLDKFDEFLGTMPNVSLNWIAMCPKCGAVTEKRIDNLVDFFIQTSQETQ